MDSSTEYPQRRPHRVFDLAKRVFDVTASFFGLILLSPFIATTAVLVHRKLGSPVIFTQERPGKDAKIFRLRKFRTMLNPDPSKGLVTDEDRLTPFGKKLRATSLDELPTLWNVLCGHMSFVGPRPLRVHYLELYSPTQARRHEVRPGVTGLAQVNGRNELDWEQKFALDVEYVDRRSLKLDAIILAQTVSTVFTKQGIAKEGHATTTPFLGTQITEPDM